MWADIPSSEKDAMLARAIEFTGDHSLYGSYMMRVTKEWPISCEHNLTDVGQNRKAWIGHAACCLAIQCPEHITRNAWGFLSKYQQDTANEAAANAIIEWELMYARQDRELFNKVEIAGVSRRDSRGSATTPRARKQSSIVSDGLRCNNEKRCELEHSWLHSAEMWGLHGVETNRN